MLASDVMIEEVASVTADADPAEVARLLAGTPFGAVVVVDGSRHPIGIVTRSDLERAHVEAAAPPPPAWLVKPAKFSHHSIPKPLRQVMSSPAIYVPTVAQLLEIGPLIDRKKLKRIPVVDDDSGLVGLLRRDDVLRAMARMQREGAAPGLTAQEFRALAAKYEEREQTEQTLARRRAKEAEKKLIEDLAKRVLTDHAWADMLAGARRAAAAGLTEHELMRFPAALCVDGGRAINAPDPNWPQTLRGEPCAVFERWRLELKPADSVSRRRSRPFRKGCPARPR